MKKFIFQTVNEIIFFILRLLGGAAFSDRKFNSKTLLKCFIWQKIFRMNGRVPWPVHYSSRIIKPEKIDRGDRCPGMSRWVHLDGRNGIRFGKNTWVGPGVRVISMNHNICDYEKYIEDSPIVIGDNCWLGANAILLPGVTLGSHVVVGAGSVVTKSFEEDNVVIAGNPAKIIKYIENYSVSSLIDET